MGQVTADRMAQIRLMVLDSTDQGHEVEALIDTGFDGALTLPPGLITTLGLGWRRRGRALLADGRESVFDIYEATIIWDGQPHRVAVDAAEVGTGRFTIHVSVPLILEYEAALRQQTTASPTVIDAMLDYHCAVGQRHRIFFLWRPYLADPKDDMVLEVAVTGQCEYIVTYNTRDFAGSERFGLQALTPDAFLTQIGALS